MICVSGTGFHRYPLFLGEIYGNLSLNLGNFDFYLILLSCAGLLIREVG